MKKKSLLITVIAIFGFAIIARAQTVPSYVPTSGLVGWWPFTGNANDSSGNGNNGTVNGATLTIDRFGNNNTAYSFDGNSEILMSVDSLPTLNSNRTLSIWCYSQNYNQLNKMLVGYGYDSPLEMFSLIMYNSCCPSTPAFWARDNDSPFPTPLNDSRWYNLSVVYKNDSIYLYKNGILVLENDYSFIPLQSPAISILKVGNFNSNVTGFEGTLDDIGIWNRALTQLEISALYNDCSASVTTQPINQSVNISNNAQFTTASSDPLATFQWQTDLGVGFQNLNSVGQYSGTANDTLTIANTTLSNDNQPFRCIVSSGSCTDTSAAAVLTVVNTVGINEFSQSNLFSVYPNPAKSQINVKVDATLIGASYAIYDNIGKVTLSGKINAENTVIELGSLSGGIYLFSIGDNLKQSFTVVKE